MENHLLARSPLAPKPTPAASRNCGLFSTSVTRKAGEEDDTAEHAQDSNT